MEFEEPSKTGFTIYSKSGCPNCLKVKRFLEEQKLEYVLISCDEFLIDNKTQFLLFIKNIANTECNFFPMVFYNKEFIGGFKETKEYVEKLLINFENENF